MAVEAAKGVLTKEKVDRQMSGQSSTTPFMRVSHETNYSTKNSCKKGVTFDALEAIEKNNDSIDKLTSLVSKMNMKIDNCEAQYKPRVYQGKKEDNTISKEAELIISLETDHTVEIEINLIETEEITIETIDQIIAVDHNTTIDMMIAETTIDMMIGEIITDKETDMTLINKTIEEIITDPIIGKIMEETVIGSKGIGLEVKVEIILQIITEIIQGKGLNEVEM